MAKTKKNPPPSPEEHKGYLLKQVREKYTNSPTYMFKVGERVQHGAVTLSHVKEILDDGKILLLAETVTETNYGNPYTADREMYVAWQEVMPWKDWKGKKPFKTNTFRLHYSQRQVDGLLHMYYGSGVEMDPDYQRGLVWDLADKEALIESIFRDVDVGKFVFAPRPYAPNSPSYEIIDGKQRLTTLIEFAECRFKWRGLTYYDLHPHDQNHFDNYPASYAELGQGATRAEILDCFVRLNTTGKPQDPKHLLKVQEMLTEESK